MNKRTLTLLAPLAAALVALLVGWQFLQHGAQTAEGIPTLPLDDAYIHLQYGWQAAQGEFLQYNSGDAPTTGATSLIFQLVLAVGFLLGITREAMPGVMLYAGLALFALTAALMADLVRRVTDMMQGEAGLLPSWGVGLAAGGFFAGSGWMAWAYLSGMETGLLLLFVTGTLWAFAAGIGWLTALLSALAMLTRPEALLLPLVILVAMALIRDPEERTDRRRWLWVLLPFVAALITPLVNLLMTGSSSATGMIAKSWLTIVPFYVDRFLLDVANTTLHLLGGLLGGPGEDLRWHVIPLAQVVALIGAVLMWVRGNAKARRMALVSVGWVVLGVVATATLQTATWHHYRYQMPFYPALIVPMTLALTMLIGVITEQIGRWGMALNAVILVLIIGLAGLYSVTDFVSAYALDTRTAAEMQIKLADWLLENTPEDALIAVHDVGVMRYVGQRRTFDVVGLTTDGMARVGRNGPGAVYEAAERARPDYYAVYPNMAPPYHGLEVASALFGEELFRVEVSPWSRFTSADGTQVVTQPDWSQGELADVPHQHNVLTQVADWRLVDRIDIADVADEDAHKHTWWHDVRPSGFASEPYRMHYRTNPSLELTDAGRLLTGGEAFTLNTPQVGQSLMLVARLHQNYDMVLRVRVNDQDAGLWKLPSVPGEWLESTFLVRADLVRGPQTRVELIVHGAATVRREIDEDETPETLDQADALLSLAHLWAYQGEPAALPPAPGTVSDASFGDVVTLRGFDLPGTRFAPGDVIPLTLYWQALNPSRADHRVFVHLMDPTNDTAEGILAQTDSQPHEGTYPFWVWRARENVTTEAYLSIPADAPAGEYRLLVGIYDGVTGARLPIVGGNDFGFSRLILGTITIR